MAHHHVHLQRVRGRRSSHHVPDGKLFVNASKITFRFVDYQEVLVSMLSDVDK